MPASAPSEALDWLANWFGVALDPSWSDAKRRLFISNAATFFEARGTVPGLMMALRLTLEDCADQSIFTQPVSQWGVRLVENYQKRWLALGIRQGRLDRRRNPVKDTVGNLDARSWLRRTEPALRGRAVGADTLPDLCIFQRRAI